MHIIGRLGPVTLEICKSTSEKGENRPLRAVFGFGVGVLGFYGFRGLGFRV